jgi:TRAP-type C4-dicarboxylate transport system substrate-binding protein
MSKRTFLGVILFLLVALPLFAVCAPAPAPTTAPTTAVPTTPAAPKVIELKVGTTTPPMAPPGATMAEFAAKMEELSNGRLKMTVFYASSLMEAREIIPSLLAGVGDIGELWADALPGSAPLNEFFGLPFLGYKDSFSATLICRKMYEKFPELTAEMKGLKILYPTVAGETQCRVHSTKKLLKTMADWKGIKFGAGGNSARYVEAMGATAVFVPYEDTFMSLEKGIMEYSFGTYGWQMGNGTVDLLKYHTNLHTISGVIAQPLLMNMDSWNKLPPDIQKLFTDVDEFYTDARIGKEMAAEGIALGINNKRGDAFYDLPKEELAKWLEVAKPIHMDWVKANGAVGQAMYDEFQKLLAETPYMGKELPSAPPPPAAGPLAAGAIGWAEALESKDFGKKVTVQGYVLDVVQFAPPGVVVFVGDKGGMAMASFGLDVPDPAPFGGMDGLTKDYKGKTILVTGELSLNTFTNKAQIKVTDPAQIKVQ